MAKKKFRIKIANRQIAVFLSIFAIIAAGVGGFLLYNEYFAPVLIADVDGLEVPFRVDLREAQQIEVLPDEDELISAIVRPDKVQGPNGQVIIRKPLEGAVIAFKITDSDTNGWYTVQVTEIIKKLTILYQGRYGIPIGFNVTEVQEYGSLEGSNSIPVIALVHPDHADGTFIDVDTDREVITISGGDSLKDFDLATVKFMMVALGIEA